MAVAWALQHSRLFTLGCEDLLVAVDHKPLLGIFNNRDLGSIKNPRIQNIKESTLPWRFTATYCPGKWTRGPDAFSRYPVRIASIISIIRESPSTTDGERVDAASHSIQVAGVYAINEMGSVTLEHIQTAAHSDQQYQDLLNKIVSGFPARRSQTEPAHLREFWEVRHRLTVFNGVALMDQRFIIPRELRRTILNNLHSANQSVSGMRSRAAQRIYWPGLDKGIQKHRGTCLDCIKHAPSQSAEPLIMTPTPSYPFEQVCADYFQLGNSYYLAVVDRFSGWLCVYFFKSGANNRTLQNIFRELFTAYGTPEELSTDGGLQFVSNDFQHFLALWAVEHRLSSVAYPQSNGRAEVAVKASKRIIGNNKSPDGSLNNDKVARAILQYRNTPLPDIGLSPAQILFHR